MARLLCPQNSGRDGYERERGHVARASLSAQSSSCTRTCHAMQHTAARIARAENPTFANRESSTSLTNSHDPPIRSSKQKPARHEKPKKIKKCSPVQSRPLPTRPPVIARNPAWQLLSVDWCCRLAPYALVAGKAVKNRDLLDKPSNWERARELAKPSGSTAKPATQPHFVHIHKRFIGVRWYNVSTRDCV